MIMGKRIQGVLLILLVAVHAVADDADYKQSLKSWKDTAKNVKSEYKTTKKTMKQQYKDGDITKPYYKEVLFFYLHKTRHTGADMKAFMAVRVSIPGSP